MVTVPTPCRRFFARFLGFVRSAYPGVAAILRQIRQNVLTCEFAGANAATILREILRNVRPSELRLKPLDDSPGESSERVGAPPTLPTSLAPTSRPPVGFARQEVALETTNALVLVAPRRLAARELPLPEIGDDDGLLRVEACGLCGTDHEEFTGELFGGFPFVPGHEAVGIIERLGPRAAARWGVRVGDRVAVEVFQSCRACDACRAGTTQRCEQHGLAEMYGYISVDRPPGLWGGYARHQYLAPDSVLHPVPSAIDPITATVFNPLGAGIRWGVTLPQTRAGDVVAVLGPGVRGLSACAAAKDAGAGFVLVTGRGKHDVPRLDIASRFGADLAIDVTSTDPVDALREATGRLADVVVDVTAKAPAAFTQAIRLARRGGTVVVAGTRGRGAPTPDFDPDQIVYKELRVLGALGVDTAAYIAALDLLATGRFPFAELPRRVAGLDGAATLLSVMAREGDVPPVHAVIAPGENNGPHGHD
jgi:alcohol dehydrogenase